MHHSTAARHYARRGGAPFKYGFFASTAKGAMLALAHTPYALLLLSPQLRPRATAPERGGLKSVRAAGWVDPLEDARRGLQALQLKGMKVALKDAVAREDYAEAARLRDAIAASEEQQPPAVPADADATRSADSPLSTDSLSLLQQRMTAVEERDGVVRAAPGCHCGADPPFSECCGPLHSDAAVATAAGPLETLLARYSAFCEATEVAAEYVMATTHRNNSEYSEDRDAWRASILDFCRSCGFASLRVLQSLRFRLTAEGLDLIDEAEAEASLPREGDRAYITWTARLRVLEGVVGDDYVETKDFVERSIFLHEDGRWWYLGGDPDFQPKNMRVGGGPLDQSGGGGGGGGGDLGKTLAGWMRGLTGGSTGRR